MKPSSCQSALDAFRELSSSENQALQGVFQRVADGCLDRIELRFASATLAFFADADDDTIEVRFQESVESGCTELQCVDSLSPWSSLIGRHFGWGWVTLNQQGYQDGVLLSFGGLEPSIMMTVAASSLRVYTIREASL